MSTLQKIITRLVPASWAASMEAESRQWMVICECGHRRSIWDLGGIRWKGGGNPSTLMNCPACGKTSWHVVKKDTAPHGGQ
jgi:hypothetical protein